MVKKIFQTIVAMLIATVELLWYGGDGQTPHAWNYTYNHMNKENANEPTKHQP